MKINEKFHIEEPYKGAATAGAICTNLLGVERTYVPGEPAYNFLKTVLNICRKRLYSSETKNYKLIELFEKTPMSNEEIAERLFSVPGVEFKIRESYRGEAKTEAEAPVAVVETLTPAEKKAVLKKILNFFSEFRFSPSIRFVNTLIRTADKADYVRNYFAIQDHSYAAEIADKIKSSEFTDIEDSLNKWTDEKSPINDRLKIYFGAPGTGKTTKALTEATKCMVCASDMLPVDLMQNFAFAEGSPEFQKSDLWKAMEAGEAIVLDEINMLPFESLRFLQGITDNKDAFDFKGHHIEIKPGFKVIGTMNLNVNGQNIPLPEPLVDRCSDIVEYTLNENLLYDMLSQKIDI